MGTVTFKLDAEEGKAVSGFLKILDAQKKVEDGQERINRKGKEHQEVTAKMGQETARELSSMVAGWFTVGTAIQAVQSAMKMMGDEQERLHRQSEEYTKSLITGLAAQGELTHQKEIDAFIRSDAFKNSGATVDQILATRKGIRERLPLADWSDINALTPMAANAGKAGYDREAFGRRVGELASFMPHSSPEEIEKIGNLAAFTISKQGDRGAKFDEKGIRDIQKYLTIKGTTPEEAIGYTLASMAAGQGTKGISERLALLTEEKNFGGMYPGKPTTVKEQLQMKYNAAGPEERKRLLNDPEIRAAVSGVYSGAVLATDKMDPEKLAREAVEAERSGQLGSDIRAASENEGWAKQQAGTEASRKAEARELGEYDPVEDAKLLERYRHGQGYGWAHRKFTYGFQRAEMAWRGLLSETGLIDKPTVENQFTKDEVEDLQKAVKEMRETAEKLNQATPKAPNPNAHVEPSGGGT